MSARASYTFDYIADPGHGWVEVPAELVRSLGAAAQPSRYSYVSRDGMTAYLEEDCDAPRFLGELMRAGHRFDLREYAPCFGDAFVRRLPSYPQPLTLSEG